MSRIAMATTPPMRGLDGRLDVFVLGEIPVRRRDDMGVEMNSDVQMPVGSLHLGNFRRDGYIKLVDI